MSSPQQFGSYVLHKRLHAGASTEIFRAVQQRSERVVALKRLSPNLPTDADFVTTFCEEAALASRLRDPHMAAVLEAGQVDRSLCVTSEYVPGIAARALFEHLAASGRPLELPEVITVVGSVCQPLVHARGETDATGRALGLLHRTPSLQKILVVESGEVKLVGFGGGRAQNRAGRTEVGSRKVKYAYMSSECARGLPVDHRTDLFSLGVCFWELVTGLRLFQGTTALAVIEKVRACDTARPATSLPEIPQQIDGIVMKALAKEAADRYATAADLFADLNAFAHTEGAVAHPQRLAALVRQHFSVEPVLRSTATSSQESRNMAENKGSSDLDVFEGLTKKAAAKPSFPPPVAPPNRSSAPGPGAPPPLVGPPGAASGRERAKTMIGMAPPGGVTGPLPRPSTPGAGALPPLAPPPGRNSALNSAPPAGPPSLTRGALPAVLPPPSRPPPTNGIGLPAVAAPPVRSVPPVAPPPNKPGSVPGGAGAVAAAATPTAAGLVDMDWDDEDEKTNVYDKEETAAAIQNISKPAPAAGAPSKGGPVKPPPTSSPFNVPPASSPFTGPSSKNLGGAAALAAGSGGAAPPAPAPLPPPAPLPLPPAGANSAVAAMPPIPGPAPVPSRFEPTQVVPRQSSGRGALFAFLGVIAVVGVVGGYFLVQRKGTVIVAVKSSGRPLERAQVFIDDRKVCETAPCRVADLEKGTRLVKVIAPGYEPADEMVAVRAGEESPVTLELIKSREPQASATSGTDPSSAPVAAKTGFKVSGSSQIRLAVDDKEIGALPQELRDLSPGDHRVKFSGGDRYKAEERTVSVTENELKDLGPVKLKVLKGKATITLDTKDARVTLVSGSERKAIPQFPISVDIDTAKQWVIEATKVGFDDFKLPITFDDGDAEKTFSVSLTEKGKKRDDTKKVDATPPVTPPGDTKPVTPPTTSDTSGTGTLNINSIPPSNCILDGRPLGPTPKAGVSVPAGTHTVIFVHPDKGRKQVGVTVRGGETKSVAIRF